MKPSKPIHAMRYSPRKPKPAATPAREYAPGYFTALIRRHNWPPRFEAAIVTGPLAYSRLAAQVFRTGTGFDAHPLGLPGATPYVVAWEARKA